MARVDHEDVATVELTTVEQRVVGSLLEKQVTVPATYPMTLNALRVQPDPDASSPPSRTARALQRLAERR